MDDNNSQLINAANNVGGAGAGIFAVAGDPFEVTERGYKAQLPYTKYPALGGIVAGQHATTTQVNNVALVGANVDFSNFTQATQAIPIVTPTSISLFNYSLPCLVSS